MKNVMDHLLHHVHVGGCLDERCELAAPWSLSNARSPDGVMPFHIVLNGTATVIRPSARAMDLAAGDVLVLPAGEPHMIRDEFSAAALPTAALTSRVMTVVVDRRKESSTVLLCGRFLLPREWWRLLRALLPPLLVVRTAGNGVSDRLSRLVSLMQEESKDNAIGSSAVLPHLSAALFGLTLRAAAQVREPAAGLLALAGHPRLGAAALAVLEAPGEPWGIQNLADLCHMSRSSVIRAFQAVAGASPAEYVARVRIAVASRMLSEGTRSVASIAEAVGYASESAFQRAFKRETGWTPAAWRSREIPGPSPMQRAG